MELSPSPVIMIPCEFSSHVRSFLSGFVVVIERVVFFCMEGSKNMLFFILVLVMVLCFSSGLGREERKTSSNFVEGFGRAMMVKAS